MIGHQLPVPDSQYGANKIHWPIGGVNNVEIELQNPISSGVFSYFVSPSLKGYPLAHASLLQDYLPVHFGKLAPHSPKLALHNFPLFVVDVRLALNQVDLFSNNLRRLGHLSSLVRDSKASQSGDIDQHPLRGCVPLWRAAFGALCILCGYAVMFWGRGRLRVPCAVALGLGGTIIWLGKKVDCAKTQNGNENASFHGIIVTQKLLTSCNYCNTVIDRANVLNTDKQIAVISALAEGSSIRSIERITEYRNRGTAEN